MKKKTLIAAILSLTLVLGACGGTKENVAHDIATETEVTSEITTEVATEIATESIGATEVAPEVTETEVATEDADETETATEKSTEKVAKEDGNKKEESNKNSNTGSGNSGTNTGNTGNNNNSGSNNSGTNTGNSDSGSNNTGSEKPGSTENPAPDTEKTVPDTEKPAPETTECKHTNKGTSVWGYGQHYVRCKDCNEDLYLEKCNYVNGHCVCGIACNHPNTNWSSDESRDGQCGYTCVDCGATNYSNHSIHNDKCSLCGRVFPCLHEFTYAEWHGSLTEHVIECESCGEYMGSEAHSFVNGMCACGCPEPVVETEAPVDNTEVPTPVIEDGATSVDVAKMWKHVCSHR